MIKINAAVKVDGAEEDVRFIYAVVGKSHKRWFNRTTFACPVMDGNWAVYTTGHRSYMASPIPQKARQLLLKTQSDPQTNKKQPSPQEEEPTTS